GPVYVSSVVGLAEPPTSASAPPVPPGLEADACSADGSENSPLTRWPVAVELGSETVSVPSPAVEITFALVVAVYVCATPGMNGENCAGRPSDSASVAATSPPAVRSCSVALTT